ncbi:MAG TPA: type VI secretion system TssO [Puia sp.]|nr:type VI secretion system TssO [Puia sp.]
MQQVLNRIQRRESFLKFLLFFVLTVVLVMLAVYFNYRLPTSENKVLREQAEVQRQQETTQNRFVTKLNEAVFLLDSLDRNVAGANLEQINIQLTGKLTELELLRQKGDPSAYGRLNNTVLDKLSQLQYAKSQVRELQKRADQYNASQQELNTVKAQLAAANNELDAIRRGGGVNVVH